MFRALWIERSGAGQVVSVRELDDAQLVEGNVLVRVAYSTINYKDGLALTGRAPIARRYPIVPQRKASVPGQTPASQEMVGDPASEASSLLDAREDSSGRRWAPSINGGEGLKWFEPLREVCPWCQGLEFRAFAEVSKGIRIQNSGFYFEKGVAFSMVGATHAARLPPRGEPFGGLAPHSTNRPATRAGIAPRGSRPSARGTVRSRGRARPGVARPCCAARSGIPRS
jgi:hypothetical protein